MHGLPAYSRANSRLAFLLRRLQRKMDCCNEQKQRTSLNKKTWGNWAVGPAYRQKIVLVGTTRWLRELCRLWFRGNRIHRQAKWWWHWVSSDFTIGERDVCFWSSRYLLCINSSSSDLWDQSRSFAWWHRWLMTQKQSQESYAVWQRLSKDEDGKSSSRDHHRACRGMCMPREATENWLSESAITDRIKTHVLIWAFTLDTIVRRG